jgi:uncharacterized protein YecE (DUF72 family)
MSGIYIGTSGWNYDHWKDHFFAGVKRKEWLRYYAEQFNAVEVNATFYRLQNPSTLAHWESETPPRFRFAIKGNRYVTHNKKLKDPGHSIELERDNAMSLGDKLAVVLWQLPGNFEKNPARLEGFAKALGAWPSVRHAVEFRHASWFDDETATCLESHGLSNCLSDAADWPLWNAVTGDLVYVRLHGHTRTYASAYSRNHLLDWAESIRAWRRDGLTVHVYFDNDAEGAAPRDALRLRHLLDDSGK